MDRVRIAQWKIEAFLAGLFAVGMIATAIFPRWIEALGAEPDRADGSAEWLIVAALGIAAFSSAIASRRHLLSRPRPSLVRAGPRP